MKCLSLWQPWASAVALGSKQIETRSWLTRYRGPLAIHAAKRSATYELIHYGACWNWCGPLHVKMGRANLKECLPFGAIVAVCDLADCRPTDSFTVGELDTKRMPPGETLIDYMWSERQMGNFEPGRFGWVLVNIRALPEPLPLKGRQGLFNLPPEITAQLTLES